MKTAEDVAKELRQRINDGLCSADDIVETLTAYAYECCEVHVKEAYDHCKSHFIDTRNEALEEAALLCEQPGLWKEVLPREIRALKAKP